MNITTKEAARMAVLYEHDAMRFAPGMSGREFRQNTAATIRSLAAERDALKDALGDLLRCTEKHVFGDECKAQRDKARAALEGKKDE
jgi:hypothetical protein